MTTKPVTVVDACMGTGKTTFATLMFNSRGPEDKFLYITPYLDEVERIQDNCPGFIQPMTVEEAERREKETGKEVNVHPSIQHCKTKSEAIEILIDKGHCITSTHALFKDIGPEVAESIRLQGYTLVMDEVLNPIEQVCFKDEEDKPITPAELEALYESNVLEKGEAVIPGKNVLQLKAGHQKNLRRGYDLLWQTAKNERLVAVDDTVLVWLLPPSLLEVFDKVYLMTYMFDFQPMAAYFKMFNIKTVKKTLWNNKLVDYLDEIANSKLSGIPSKITIHDRGQINDIGNTRGALSKGWYEKSKKVKCNSVANNLYYFFCRHINNVPKEEWMWTTYKMAKAEIGKHGQAGRFMHGFLANNTRATNDYRHKSTLAYCCNFHMHPYIKRFFDYGGVDPHQDQWALSEMLQWIWRSRIREDKDITVYIPSKRMRDLMTEWLTKVAEWTKGADTLYRAA
jgi:hypothetical protein